MIKRLTKLITSTIKTSNDFSRQQERLNVIIGKQSKQDYVKLELPKKYADMIEVIALYGIKDSIELRRIIEDYLNSDNYCGLIRRRHIEKNIYKDMC